MRHYKNNLCFKPIPFDVESCANQTIDAACIVHRKLGPGLKEKTYEKCLAKELNKKGLSVKKQINIQVIYDGEYLDDYYRVDMIVEDKLIIEIKAVERLVPFHRMQILTYLKISGKRLGLLINFNSEKIAEGVKRVVF